MDRRCSFAKTTNNNINDDDKEEEVEHKHQESGSALWPITCGIKDGLLDVEKLKRGEKCIHCEGRWFIPPDFEKFGGKGSTKKWKATIFHNEKSLEVFFKEGVLSTGGFYKGKNRTKKQNRTLPSKREPGDLELPSRERRKAANRAYRRIKSLQLCIEESSDDDDDGDRCLGSREQVMLTEEEEDDSDEGEDINSGDADSENEEDERECNEPEDEDVLTDMDHPADQALTIEMYPKMIISTPKNLALQSRPKVLIKRLSMDDYQTNSLKHPTEDTRCFTITESLFKSLNKLADKPDTEDSSDSSIIDNSETESSQITDIVIDAGVSGKNEEELNIKTLDEQRGTKVEIVSCSSLSPATRAKEKETMTCHNSSLETPLAQLDTDKDIKDEDKEADELEMKHCGMKEEVETMSISDETESYFGSQDVNMATNVSPQHPPFKEEVLDSASLSTAAPSVLVGIHSDNDDSAQMTPETCHYPNNLGPSSLPLTSSCHTASTATSLSPSVIPSTEGQGQKGNKKQQAYRDRMARRRLEAREKRRERREVRMSESLGRIATALELLSSKQDTVIALLQRLADQK